MWAVLGVHGLLTDWASGLSIMFCLSSWVVWFSWPQLMLLGWKFEDVGLWVRTDHLIERWRGRGGCWGWGSQTDFPWPPTGQLVSRARMRGSGCLLQWDSVCRCCCLWSPFVSGDVHTVQDLLLNELNFWVVWHGECIVAYSLPTDWTIFKSDVHLCIGIQIVLSWWEKSL